MKLIKPTLKLKDQYLLALGEALADTEGTTLTKPKINQSFTEFLNEINNESDANCLLPGRVPATTFWLIDRDEFIGRVQIRHLLNDWLLNYGGHIGYYIRPSKRKKGYGKKILELALIEAKKMGLKKILVTCDETNTASIKIIEANGGVYENTLPQGDGKPPKLRYWINVK